MRRLYARWKLVFIGILVLWIASTAFALQLKTLLTPGNYPIGTDPSFDIIVDVFFFVLSLFGAVLIWRGVLDGQNILEGGARRNVNLATAFNAVLLVVVLFVGILLFSANSAFIRGYHPLVLDEPRPDYSVPTFPAPASPIAAPTDMPGAVLLSGNLISDIDGFRFGQIAISLSATGDTIEYIQLYIFRTTCRVQQDGSSTAYAVDESKPVITGPIKIQDGNFLVNQGIASIQGIIASPQSAYGSLYLHYTDTSSNQSCEFGSFTWTAAPAS